ncbi:hypothetical protein [Desulfonatronum sp. SC1]|uniref:hypothetical protein n=1 Tax=Desulfonatronum sp. SC1 TaxID=2109626 RepID=UPI0011B1CB5C|nr:hypothetical protein [Desulfonatronum sp. SC1]
MDVKKMWGVIFVVLGVGLVCWGGYSLVQVSSASAQMKQLGGSMLLDVMGVNEAISAARNRGIVILVLGLAAAVGGTLLLKEKNKELSTS